MGCSQSLTRARNIEEVNILRDPRSYSFWLSRNLSKHMDRQAHTGDAVLVKSREMTGIGAKHCRGGWREEGKRRQKTKYFGPVATYVNY
jgi:hypothetical protein